MDTLLNFILLPWWFSLPGYVANICPGLARSLPYGTVPVSIKYLGPNKTWAAIPASMFGAGLTAHMQTFLTYPASFPEFDWWVIVLCFGLGVPLGDWTKSLLKRVRRIPPGGKWWVESIDFLVASFILLTITQLLTSEDVLPFQYYLVPLTFYILVHGPGNRLSYKLGWRNSPN